MHVVMSCRIALIAGTFYGLPVIQFVLGQQLVCIIICLMRHVSLIFVVRVFLIMAIKTSATTILSAFIHGE